MSTKTISLRCEDFCTHLNFIKSPCPDGMMILTVAGFGGNMMCEGLAIHNMNVVYKTISAYPDKIACLRMRANHTVVNRQSSIFF